MSARDLAAVKHLHLLAGDLAIPGAPILQLSLTYNPETGSVNGEAVISQAVTPPGGRIAIPHVRGQVHMLGLGPTHQVLAVSGEYAVPVTPPFVHILPMQKFQATFLTDGAWSGHGSFEYADHRIENVPVHQAK